MSLVAIISTFVTCLIFNVFLNSFDIYSDVALTYNTLTFNVGESFLLSGCKVCHGKEEIDVFSVKNDPCQVCLTRNNNFQCGSNFEVLDRLNELEKNEVCGNNNFTFSINSTLKSYEWNENTCSDDYNKDVCCVEIGPKKNRRFSLDLIDRRIAAYMPMWLRSMRNSLPFDIYVLSGTLSNTHCQQMYLDYLLTIGWTSEQQMRVFFKRLEDMNIPEGDAHYFKFKRSLDGHIDLKKGFDGNDECGLYFTNKQRNNIMTNNGESCGSDSCLIHLQNLKYSNNVSSFNEWKENTYFYFGRKSGGKTCQIMWQYGLATLGPILINMIFHIFAYMEDLKSNNVTLMESICVLFLCYPQYKCLKFLVKFMLNRDEEKLQQDKNEFDSYIGLLEPFLEAAIQVSF